MTARRRDTPARICSRCPSIARPGQAYCAPYHAAYMRANRKRWPLSPEQQKKATARCVVKMAVRRGKLERKPCEVCGKKTEKHHDDYSQPLQVR